MRQHRRILVWGLSLVLAIALFKTTTVLSARAQSAEATFRTAYENRYTWDEPFPGYRAEVSVNYYGTLEQGIVTVKPDLSVEVANIENKEIRQFVENQLKMEVIHRRQVPFDRMHGENRFELAQTDDNDGALRIREIGEGIDAYKVKDNIITQVNRTFGDVAVTVDTIGTTKTPQGYLVSQFQTTYRDAETGAVLEKEDVLDFHQKISRYYFLTSRDIRYAEAGDPAAKRTYDIRLDFNDFQPLSKG